MYKLLPHPADIKLRITAEDLFSLLQSSLEAINFYLKPKLKTTKFQKIILKEKVDLNVISLIDFLNRILSLIYIKKKIFIIKKLDKDRIILKALPIEKLEKEIKAITYHQAKLFKRGKNFIFEFIIDV